MNIEGNLDQSKVFREKRAKENCSTPGALPHNVQVDLEELDLDTVTVSILLQPLVMNFLSTLLPKLRKCLFMVLSFS